ncbi:Lysosomal acid phosphatase [Fasciola hepatica]|uniref:Lysosomal acid phosphatase n=1 Tax=Fasciola hepatica TaxID=6192 RepID=A0A2H1C9D2_FASHE|nr:Lysosomal acid phosphatase [Fasciola hepatica]
MQQKYTSTSLIVRLEIGVFLSLLRDHLLAIVSGSHFILNRRHHLAVQHLMAYSAHDTDVCYLLAAFGAYYEHIIPYSAAIVIELLGPKPPAPASEYRLRLVYKRGYLDSEGHYVQFGACTNEPAVRGCPLEDVLAFLSPLFLEPDNFDAECQVETRRNIPYPLLFSRSATPFSCTSHGKTKWYIVCISATCATLAILGVVALLLSIHSLRRRRRRHLQHSLNNTLDYASCKT